MFACVRVWPYEKPLNSVPNSRVREMSNSEQIHCKCLKKCVLDMRCERERQGSKKQEKPRQREREGIKHRERKRNETRWEITFPTDRYSTHTHTLHTNEFLLRAQ